MDRFVPRSLLGERLIARRDELLAAADRRGLEEVRTFGSVVRGEDTEGSDIDLLVRRLSGSRALSVIGFEEDVEALLGVSVDVVSDSGLSDRSREEILATAVPL